MRSGAALVLGVAGVGACFNPHYQAGTVQCSEPDQQCPLGLVCSVGVCVTPGDGGASADGGPAAGLRAQGASLIDGSGATVRLTAVSWYGFDGPHFVVDGLLQRPYGAILDTVKALGYNVLRLPYADQLFDLASQPDASVIDAKQNPTLVGLSSLAILDLLIAGAETRGLKVVLARRHAAAGASDEALWYTAQYSEARWIADLRQLANRYQQSRTVIGFQIATALHAPVSWGDGDAQTDWQQAAARGGDAVLAIKPEALIFVAGIDSDGYWPGGGLSQAQSKPVVLSDPRRLVYATIDWPKSVASQPWFAVAGFPANMPALWDQSWGYLVKDNLAPVLLGEFGGDPGDPVTATWLGALIAYLNTVKPSFAYWCLNGDDPDGLLEADWMTPNGNRQGLLMPLLAPPLK